MAGPFLIGSRVQLRAFEETDASILSEWINDPELRRAIIARFPVSIKDEKEWIAAMSGKRPPADMAFGIELKRGRRLIGSVGLHQISWVQRRAMTGIFLYPASMRGAGYGTEAKDLLLDYAFGELGMRSLWADAIAGNTASIRALEKQGYRRNGIKRKAVLVRGVWTDLLYFDILREEWESLRGIGKRDRVARPRRTPVAPAAKKPAERGRRT